MEGALEVGLREQFRELQVSMTMTERMTRREDVMKGKISAVYEEKVNGQISAAFEDRERGGRGGKGKMMTLADVERAMGQNQCECTFRSWRCACKGWRIGPSNAGTISCLGRRA